MQALRGRLLCTILLASFLLAGCTSERLSSASPNRRYRLIVQEKWFVHEGRVYVTLERDSTSINLYDRPGDWMLGLVQVYWSPDSKFLGLLACNQMGTNLLVAYDLLNRRPMSDKVFLPEIRERLIRKYRLDPKNADPIEWACSENGTDAFEARRKILE
jgi:hypothetical protein